MQNLHCVRAKRLDQDDDSTFFGFAEFGDYGEVFEGGGVALDFAVSGEFAEEAAHDFAASGFGQGFSEADVVGTGKRADFF